MVPLLGCQLIRQLRILRPAQEPLNSILHQVLNCQRRAPLLGKAVQPLVVSLRQRHRKPMVFLSDLCVTKRHQSAPDFTHYHQKSPASQPFFSFSKVANGCEPYPEGRAQLDVSSCFESRISRPFWRRRKFPAPRPPPAPLQAANLLASCAGSAFGSFASFLPLWTPHYRCTACPPTTSEGLAARSGSTSRTTTPSRSRSGG